MPWQEVSIVSSRLEFCRLAMQEGANVRSLCRRFGIAPKTGYKWLARYRRDGAAALTDRSRRPYGSPRRTSEAIETIVLTARAAHPAWGGRKLHGWLVRRGQAAPHPNTITEILRRHGRLTVPSPSRPLQRFERDAPNELWQMDFKGHFPVGASRCHPLGVLDDHARYALCLKACANERRGTVQTALTETFRRYGLPEAMLMDHGPPWGYDPAHPYTRLALWLLRLGVKVLHGRPRHPQTQGKQERFHRTLNVELLQHRAFPTLTAAQRAFDAWRSEYNLERPHEALGLKPPISRYRPSSRPFPEVLAPIEYDATDTVLKVGPNGEVRYRGRCIETTRALIGEYVAVRALSSEGRYGLYYGGVKLLEWDAGEEQ